MCLAVACQTVHTKLLNGGVYAVVYTCEADLPIFDHQAGKEDPSVRAALSHQGVCCALHYVLHHLLLYLGSDCWRG